MAKSLSSNIKLGIFVLAGAFLLILALYLIGSNQNLFGSRIHISADFRNVSGLTSGNNVRFAGIDIGTVESIEITNDSTVKVIMVIDNKVKEHIKKNSLASVGTDGLMGNRLVNIITPKMEAESIEEGDVLNSLQQIETDEMMRTLNSTNENIEAISNDLRIITGKLKSENSLWSILMDTTVAANIKNAVVNIQVTSDRTAMITGDLSAIVKDVSAGHGTIGALLTDTSMLGNINQAIVRLDVMSNNMALVTGDLKSISGQIKSGEGSVGALIMDTTFVHDLNATMLNLKAGSAGLNENMEAFKDNFLVRRHFRKLEKEKAKGAGK